jgi:hypothetical protein
VLTYEGEEEDDGEIESIRIETEVLASTRTVMGVQVREVRDREFINGVLVEDTIDFFAQDAAGNVWYFGEEVTNYEYDDDGNLIATNDHGSWQAGENGALSGIQMWANPPLGLNYYQEFAPLDEAIDEGIVHDVARDISIDLGDFEDTLVIRELNALEPGKLENKIHAQGIGLVLIEEDLDEDGEPGVTIELVSIESD